MELTQIRTTSFHDGTTDDIWEITHDPIPELGDGEVTVKLDWVSLDPAMRGWTTNKRSYMPPVQPGEIMRAFGVGEVLASKSKFFGKGDWVTGFTGLATAWNFNQNGLRKIDTNIAEPKDYLAGLGMTGYTAYFGMTDIGKPEEGQTVVVSAASGAVGSVAAQVAKLAGARVIGIAGGPEKVGYLLEELGLDGAIDYKNEDIKAALKRECPDGIDVYYDNVGGETLSAVMAVVNYKARVVICGAISQYSDFGNMQGPDNFLQVIAQSVTIQGFTMKDYMHRIPEAFEYLLKAKHTGTIKFQETIVEGLESFPDAVQMLFTGGNKGKLLLKVTK